jgi:heme/copper-type cytochrome/quinol oxidase subunit 3
VQPATDPSGPGRPRARFAKNGTLGMALFVFTEVMMFSGFISAFTIVRDVTGPGMWPPPDQPRLPIERTAFNTVALLLSGVALFMAGRRFRKSGAQAAQPFIGAALVLGAFFVIAQGMEWVALLRQGLTLTSSQLGSFFFVIIGTHALHAIAAIVALGFSWHLMRVRRLTDSGLAAVELFWFFVVLIWPILYWRVYL